MKLKDVKHDHTLTKILKVCLFSLIMFMPFLAVLPSGLYFAFNEHAQNYTHETVNTTYEYETNEVNSVDDLIAGNIYKVDIIGILNEYVNDGGYPFQDYNFISFFIKKNDNVIIRTDEMIIDDQYAEDYYHNNIAIEEQLFWARYSINQFTTLYYQNADDYNLYLEDLGGSWIYAVLEDIDWHFSFTNIGELIMVSDYLGEKNVQVVSSEQSPLNAFYAACNEVWQQPMFNWVNTGLGTVAVYGMLSVFGISANSYIANLIVYWLSITAIYIILDVVISLFTTLTHIITKKAE